MVWPFHPFQPHEDFDVYEFGDLLMELRAFHGALASSAPSHDEIRQLREDLQQWRVRLDRLHVEPDHSPYGQLDELPSHGLGSLPAWYVTEETPTMLRARFRFSRWHVGGGAAAHGGMVGMVFDDLLGALASVHGEIPARTAYLTTNFRALTPVDVELEVIGTIARTEGRKLYLRGELWHDTQLCADADALFVVVGTNQKISAATPPHDSVTMAGRGVTGAGAPPAR